MGFFVKLPCKEIKGPWKSSSDGYGDSSKIDLENRAIMKFCAKISDEKAFPYFRASIRRTFYLLKFPKLHHKDFNCGYSTIFQAGKFLFYCHFLQRIYRANGWQFSYILPNKKGKRLCILAHIDTMVKLFFPFSGTLWMWGWKKSSPIARELTPGVGRCHFAVQNTQSRSRLFTGPRWERFKSIHLTDLSNSFF